MKQIFLGLVLALGLVAVVPASDADARRSWRGGGDSGSDSGGASGGADSGGVGDSASGVKTGVPELSPTLAGSALVLLLGGAAYIASRRREDV